VELSGPAFGGDAKGYRLCGHGPAGRHHDRASEKWSTCPCTVGAVHSNLVRPRGVRTQSRQVLLAGAWTAGAEYFRVPATERGRHGNGYN
jgi:hypothetical protein